MNKVLQAFGQWVCGMRRRHGPWRIYRKVGTKYCRICGEIQQIKRRGPRKSKDSPDNPNATRYEGQE